MNSLRLTFALNIERAEIINYIGFFFLSHDTFLILSMNNFQKELLVHSHKSITNFGKHILHKY